MKNINEVITNYDAKYIASQSEELIKLFSTIDTTVTKDNMKEMSEISTNLNKMAKTISDNRIAWKKEATAVINAEEKLIKNVHLLLSEKREEIKSNAEQFLAIEKAARVEEAKGYFEVQLKNYAIYEWITFEKHIYESTMETKGACTYDKEDGAIIGLTKKIKDLIDYKLEKFSNDRLMIDTFCEHTGDSTAIVTYQENALKTGTFNSAGAIKYAEQVIEKNKELAAFKEAKKQADAEVKTEIINEVKTETKATNQRVITKKKSNTTTIIVELPNEMKKGFVGMLRERGIKFRIEGE